MKKDHQSALLYLLGSAVCLILAAIFFTFSWGAVPALIFLGLAGVAFLMAWNLGWPWL
jgi:uncharacterized membrane protein